MICAGPCVQKCAFGGSFRSHLFFGIRSKGVTGSGVRVWCSSIVQDNLSLIYISSCQWPHHVATATVWGRIEIDKVLPIVYMPCASSLASSLVLYVKQRANHQKKPIISNHHVYSSNHHVYSIMSMAGQPSILPQGLFVLVIVLSYNCLVLWFSW
jgi:hypothetical protein